jgi:methylmalonyl-CoA/ethylmalonyl-CoA epimerase
MNVIGIDHIVIAAEDLDETTSLFNERLGVSFGGLIDAREYENPDMREQAKSRLSREGIEIASPTDDNHAIAKYLEESGPGVFAVMLEVADAEAAREELTEQDVEPAHVVQHENDEGHFMTEVIYHPRHFGGMMTGLIEFDAPHPVERPVLE